MAKTRVVYRNRPKKRRSYRRRTGGLLKNKMVVGAMIAIGAPMVAQKLGVQADIAELGAGYLSKNPVLVGYNLGKLLVSRGGGLLGGATSSMQGWL